MNTRAIKTCTYQAILGGFSNANMCNGTWGHNTYFASHSGLAFEENSECLCNMDGKVLIWEYQRGSVTDPLCPKESQWLPLMHSEETPVPRGHELPKNRREPPRAKKLPKEEAGSPGKPTLLKHRYSFM